ncbi:MAG: transglutaminase domain-containing protein [Alphaproteobacteria bacterium]|nr:transglutaminase domain-containing protein [Alphaproteobacteria bacterium]
MSKIIKLFQTAGYDGVNEKEADATIDKWGKDFIREHPSIEQSMKDYFKETNIKIDDFGDFIASIKKNTKNSMDKDQENLQAPLPDLKNLPPPIQKFVNSINNNPDLSSLDKIAIIHNFASKEMDYNHKEAKNETSISSNYNEVLQNYKSGDCDNHATLEIALLRYTGFPPEDITFLGGYFGYRCPTEEEIEHAVCIVNVDDQLYILDSNMKNPEPLTNKTVLNVFDTFYVLDMNMEDAKKFAITDPDIDPTDISIITTYSGHHANESKNEEEGNYVNVLIKPVMLHPIQNSKESLIYYDPITKKLEEKLLKTEAFSEVEEEVNNANAPENIPENTHDAAAPLIENSLPSPMP